jgi:hypothetical protein
MVTTLLWALGIARKEVEDSPEWIAKIVEVRNFLESGKWFANEKLQDQRIEDQCEGSREYPDTLLDRSPAYPVIPEDVEAVIMAALSSELKTSFAISEKWKSQVKKAIVWFCKVRDGEQPETQNRVIHESNGCNHAWTLAEPTRTVVVCDDCGEDM